MGTLKTLRSLLTGGGVEAAPKVDSTSKRIGLNVQPAGQTVTGPKMVVSYAAGANANTNIPISGITTSDILISVLEIQPPTATTGGTIKSDQTANTTIPSNGNIRISQSTAGNQVWVLWWDVA